MNKIKKAMLGLTVLAMAVMPFATQAADVQIESRLQVENVTTGSGYKKNVSAKVDEVVAIQVWYHNKEEENSGKVANNLKVNIDLPQGVKGKTQTVKSTTSADNTNTVQDTATIDLSLDRAYLEFIPGESVWRHNAGTNANPNWVNTKLSANQESQLLGGGLVLENAQPCFNFEATVTILARVRADVVSVEKFVRKDGEKDWKKENTAKPGDTLEYLIRFKNEGNTVLKNVAVGDNMPARVTYVKGSTMLANGTHPQGIKITSDNITTGGIDVGNYHPGAAGYVWFKAKIDSDLKAGDWTFKNVGVVRPEGMNEFFNVAITKVKVVQAEEKPPQPPVPPVPEQPAQPLPETGVGALAGIGGTSALGYALRGYIRSRRSLIDELLDK